MNRAYIKEVGLGRWLVRTAIRQYHKRVRGAEHAMTLPTGETFWLPPSSRFASEAFISNGDVDWGSERLFYDLFPAEGTFLDVGANIGYYSVYFLPKAARVFSFEPDPNVRPLLERNAAGRNRIEIIPRAVGSQEGEAAFVVEANAEVSHLQLSAHAPASAIRIPVTTVDRFVSERGISVHAIKIDVEGFDLEVLRGAETVLRNQRPIVLTEAALEADLIQLAERLRYALYAHGRDRHTRRRSFSKIVDVSQGADRDFKMIFLCPEERAAELDRLVLP